MNQWRLAWRNLMRRKFRSFLIFMSIVIGVASSFAVIAAVESAEKAFPLYLKAAFGKADFNLTGSDAYFQEDVFQEVEKLDHTVSIAVLKENTKLHVEDDDIAAIQKRVTISGYSNLDTPITNFKVIEGDLTAGGAVITDKTAKAWNVKVGDEIAFDTDQGLKTIEISAIVNYTAELMGPSDWMMANYHHWSVAVPLAVVQEWFDLSGQIENVQVKAEQGANLENIEQDLHDFVHQYDRLYMQPVVVDADSTWETLNSFFSALYIAGFLGIVLSAFIVFNSLFVSMKERKDEFAVLKTIGYTDLQIQAMVLAEVILLAIIGTVVGLMLGYGLGLGLKALIFLISSVQDEGSMELGKGIVISVAAGLFVPIIASLYPIHKAGKASVIEVLKENKAVASQKKWIGMIGVLLIFSAFFIKHLILIVPLMIGLICVYPYLFKMFNYMLKPIYKLFFSFSGEMAVRNLNRHISRSSMTSVVLCLGIALIVLMSSLNSALLQTYEKMIYSSYGGNLDVMFHHIEGDDLEKMKAVDGVADAQSYSLQQIIWTDDDRQRKLPVFGVGETWIEQFPLFTTTDKSKSDMIEQLKSNEIILDQIAYDLWGGKVGDSISLDTIEGTKKFKVKAVVHTMKNSGYGAFMKDTNFKDHFGVDYDKNILVLKDENVSPLQLRENIFNQYGERIESMFGPEDWVTVIGSTYTGSFTIINALVVLSILVSGIGITNTLLINVMERVREIGMMRAIGITRRQIIGMILLEGLAIGIAATFIGTFIGVFLIYLTSNFMEINSLTFDFGVSWMVISLTFLFGIVISLISSFMPASKGAKIKLSEALRYE